MRHAHGGDEKRPAIVFVHGLLGFAVIRLPLLTIRYFRNLAGSLDQFAADCFFPKLPPAGTVVERAETLAAFLVTVRSRRIFLIAHSMGGLDCRYLIHRLDPEHRIRALVTVGTPHHGTPLAVWFQESDSRLAWAGRKITRPALQDLTPEACNRFNATVPDRAGVAYFSYAGCRPSNEMALLFRSWTRMVQKKAGDNDGQVPVSSARWGKFLGQLRADHFELAGWSFSLPNRDWLRPFDHTAFYHNIVRDLLEMD